MNKSIHGNAAELQRLYGDRFAGLSAYRNAVWQRLCRDYFSRWIPASATVLDLGAGHCEFVNNVTAARKYALDLNPDAKEAANADVTLLLHDCTTPWPIEADHIDVVFTSNFLEHLPDKDAILDALHQAHRVLRPGGKIIAMGPNARKVGGKYWDFFDHHVALTERSLAEAFESAGFHVTTCVGQFLPYTMSGGRPKPVGLVTLYLKMPWAWKILGQQFLVVAERS
jgi:SAM-dependent methyltransferase